MNQPAPTLERYTVAAREPDPSGTGLVGQSSTIHLDREPIARPLVELARPEGEVAVMEVDVYPAEVAGKDGSPGLMVLVLCPRCRNQNRITSDRKAIEFEPGELEWDGERMIMVPRGMISIEPFECTWELEPEGRRMHAGLSLCRYAMGIDKNVARRA